MRIHLSALGCRLNEAELEQWANEFSVAGDHIANLPDEADILVMNTCAVTKEAVRKSKQKIQRLQRSNPQAKLVVSGCYSELAATDEMAELGIDLVVPNQKKDVLVPLTHKTFADISMPAGATQPDTAALFRRNRHRAFIKIQDGCRYRCTFCIVTVARGDEQSRRVASIVNEVRQLESADVKEVVLTGVHVGGYGSDIDSDLATLVRSLLNETNIPRIRFASVEPWDLSPDFLTLFDNPRVMPHMHLPLQSGSDSVLRRMARRCKTQEFNALTTALRERIPNFNVTTDIIVGFPGETESEWQDSIEFIQSQYFGHTHIFTYSEREGTKAARLPDSVPKPIRQQRSRELHDLSESTKRDQLEKSVGSAASVLWERGKLISEQPDTPLWRNEGYTPNYQRVVIETDTNLANQILPTQLHAVEDGKLIGRLIS